MRIPEHIRLESTVVIPSVRLAFVILLIAEVNPEVVLCYSQKFFGEINLFLVNYFSLFCEVCLSSIWYNRNPGGGGTI